MLIKRESLTLTFHNLGSCDFWQTSNSVLSIRKYTIPSLCNGYVMFSSLCDKANRFTKISEKSNPNE